MQLFTLNAAYRPNVLIEGYFSLIWTERFRPCGDFELQTYNIDVTRKAMPIGIRVCILDSEELGFVETHEISVNKDGKNVLKITGRTFESFFENRITLIDETSIKNAIDETNATVVTNEKSALSAVKILRNSISTALDFNNELPGVEIALDPTTYADDTPVDRFILRGSAYSEFLKIMDEEDLGIRNIRPKESNNLIKCLVFSGRDKTQTVIFDATANHFTGNIRYFWSNENYKSAVYVASKNAWTKVYAPNMSDDSGLLHRVDLLDIPDITQSGAQAVGMLTAKGKAYLAQHKPVMFMEGSVSPEIPYRIYKDYRLGDTVGVKGEYGVSQDMKVVEYVRVEDESGERAYPTLS